MGKDLKGKELGVGFTQRKDGLYQARYKDRFGITKTIYGHKLPELRKQYAVAVAADENMTGAKKDIKLDAWFERWVKIYKEKNVRPNTLREYTNVYKKNISPFLGNCKICSIVKSNVQQVVDNAHDSGYGYERQNKIRVVLLDMLERAVEDDLIVKNPAKGIKLRAEKKIKAESLTIEQQNDFLEACKNTFYENLFCVALNTGLRPGELCALNLSDIDFENRNISVTKTLVYQKYLTDERKTFHIEPPKTKQSYRKVPINSTCEEYLRRQMELKGIVSEKSPKQQNDFLFVTKFNTPINSMIYNDAIRATIRDMNLLREKGNMFPVFNAHTFRHTFATRCFEAGVDAKVVQSYLGHASLKMTMDLYTHVTDEKSAADIEKIVSRKESKIIELKIS